MHKDFLNEHDPILPTQIDDIEKITVYEINDSYELDVDEMQQVKRVHDRDEKYQSYLRLKEKVERLAYENGYE